MKALLIPRQIEVSSDFLLYADEQWNKVVKGKKVYGSREKVDALLYEWWMITHRYVIPPRTIAHDFIWNGQMIDCKEISQKNFNIQAGKTEWYVKSINRNQLTHFLFYETDRDTQRILQKGDIVNITPICILPAKTVLKSMNESGINGHDSFISKSTLKMLAEDDDANTRNESAA